MPSIMAMGSIGFFVAFLVFWRVNPCPCPPWRRKALNDSAGNSLEPRVRVRACASTTASAASPWRRWASDSWPVGRSGASRFMRTIIATIEHDPVPDRGVEGGAAFGARSQPWSLLLAVRRRRRAASAACGLRRRGARAAGLFWEWGSAAVARELGSAIRQGDAAHARGKGLNTCASARTSRAALAGAKLSRVSRDASPELGIDRVTGREGWDGDGTGKEEGKGEGPHGVANWRWVHGRPGDRTRAPSP